MKEQIDDLVYTYDGNKLHTVVDGSGNYAGYPDTSGTLISYDDNGNMTSHEDKGVVNIQYNYLNLPSEIKFNSSYTIRNYATGEDEIRNVRNNYIYRADGVKLSKKYTSYFSKFKAERTTTTAYLDGFQYTVNYLGAASLDFVPTSEGYYDFKNNRYIYSYTDHLGNVRLSYFRNANSSAEVLEENNYYPFGLKHQGYNILEGNPAYKYQYNGKELQEETGWNDYGARMYMSDIGRWGVIDPLAEQMRRYSPYNYAFNNPISYIDPDGRKSMIYSDGGVMRWEFDPITTVNGVSWFADYIIKLSGFGGSQILAQGLKGGGGDGSRDKLDPGEPFVGSQLYKDVMAYLNSSESNFSQFDFSTTPGEDVTIGKDGKVVSKKPKNGPNRFFDESGKQLFFNDPDGVNSIWMTRKFNVGDRIYYPVSIKEMFDAINSVGSNGAIRFNRYASGTGPVMALIFKESMWGEADFSAHFLSRKIGEDGTSVYQNDSSYNIRFGNSNRMFSLMDAGNAMWGLWTMRLGLTNYEVKAASHMYELIFNHSFDTPADQRAMFYFLNMLNKK